MKNFSLKKYLRVLINLLGPFRKLLKIDPNKNWMTLIVLFVLVNFLFMISSFGIFSSINSDESSYSGEANSLGGSALDIEALNETLSRFETKEENFENLKETRPFFVDPSI